ncbi:MAG: hypothetical protein MMC23_004116 [Stictis urceolatum]|nr:hypothetical protein [Stictis urceolata]
MVLIALAATLPVNPSGSSMILTHSDVWSGLIEKCLRPHTGFVKPIVDCKVNEHARTVIDRTVTFEKGFTMGKEDEEAGVHERVELVEGYSCEFIQDSGSKVLNLLSRGPAENELYLTFGFKWIHDEWQEGDPAIEKKRNDYLGISYKAIESTIATIRRFKEEGKAMGK